ncbi:DUF6084 family protein [Saccharomonospora iraqiensis]|uniref:DUF6084 family protein n=1 Tax=Saccharomonospora iraqiensis TaxID=52698 RepID=UPI00022E67D9|nr:DUF6084 family protein [Saccharomonospora iraqiensis]
MSAGTGVAPSFTWRVAGVTAEPMATVPTLRLSVEIGTAPGADGPVRVHCLVLSVSVRIAAALRDYDPDTRGRLRAVFGTDGQWADSLGDLVWARPTVVVPGFAGGTTVDVPVPCGQDLDLASASYLHAVLDGDVPLRLLFGGTVFHARDGRLATAQLPADSEAHHRMPAARWHELRERYFGGHRWLRLDRETHDRLHDYRVRQACPSPQAAIEELLTKYGT